MNKSEQKAGQMLYNRRESCHTDTVEMIHDEERNHMKMGYTPEGKHDRCAFKFGRWYSVIWMGKVIAERPEMPEAFIPLSELKD